MTDWLKYEWEYNEREAVFQVDMQYWELLPTLAYSQLVFVSVAPHDPDAEAFSHAEERRATALQHTLAVELEDAAIFVGGIGMKNLIQYYFYTADEKLIHRVSALCRAENKLSVSCGHVAEPHYATYYCLLFPDDAKLQSVENAAYIKSVQHRDGDLSLVRRVRLCMAFVSEEACDAFMDEIPHLGFTMGGRESVGNTTHPYRVTLNGFSTLMLPDLNRFTARAIRGALPYGGVLDHITADFINRH
ncbi:MAG: DUF695 domain-containing protein [Clostridia bacterium]|nr:DUF695 domain-containing protein [Clostridia bacterium]